MGISPERVARDQADQVYYVPENMTYREWEKNALSSQENVEKRQKIDYNENDDSAQKIIAEAIFQSPITIDSCTVEEETYGLPDGYGGVKKTVSVTTYKTPDGTKFVFPKEYNKAHQTMTPEQAIECWQKVPEAIRKKAQKEIVFVDYYNPADSYWKKLYKNFDHSYATGGSQIAFYRYDYAHDMDYVVRTYLLSRGGPLY